MQNDCKENLMSSSSQGPISTGKPVAFFSSKNKLNQETFSDGEDFPLRHQQVFGSNEPFFRFSNPVNAAKSLLDGNRDHLLAEARSELMKQEYKLESLNTCTSELQRQTHSQWLELEDVYFGYEESGERAISTTGRTVMKEKALRDTQITSIHEMEELKRVHEMRVDEFIVQRLREIHDKIQKLTSCSSFFDATHTPSTTLEGPSKCVLVHR